MPAPTPVRNRRVYFVGAGLSCALGLPNTPSLLVDVLSLADQKTWLQSEELPARIQAAIEYFYPDGPIEGFQPTVVDFFSALKTYVDIGSGLVGGLKDAPSLYRDLRFAIAHLLTERLRAVDDGLRTGHTYLDEVVQPGNIVITSNWDHVIERYAALKQIPLRLSGTRDSELVLLKLHGSIDWCTTLTRANRPDGDYATLAERLFAGKYQIKLPSPKSGEVIRVRALERWSDSWRMIKSRADELFMVTMARGKAGDLGPLQHTWRDAYGAISRAQHLEIVGYSMPADDIEIRTLLRSGVTRGTGPKSITVKNPSPDVHDRLRRYLHRDLGSDYQPVNAL